MTEFIGPSEEVSRDLINAISGALKEEKKSRSLRLGRVLLLSTLTTLLLSCPLYFMFREELSLAWKLAMGFWWLCLTVGFYLYYLPQPRLEVPGYLSPWILAKILISMTVLTVIQILICPSFVFLETPFSWSPFESLTHLFMSWGGMQTCMFLCGLLMTVFGGVLSFLIVARTLKEGDSRNFTKVLAIAYLSQAPLLLVQILDGDLRPYVVFWIVGGLLGLAMALGLSRALTRLKFYFQN